jgi:hypothetical protein
MPATASMAAPAGTSWPSTATIPQARLRCECHHQYRGSGARPRPQVNAATLDGDLHAIAGALIANDAGEVAVTSGDLNGHQFLIVDVNGNAQYDGGSDYLIDITGHTGTITAGNFL